MAYFHSPRVVTDGLILYLDVGSDKSFRGEPTTNVVSNPLPVTSWGVSNFGGSTATRTFLTENNIPFVRYTDVTSISGYPRFQDSVFLNSAIITGTFSTSFEARGTTGAELMLRIYENGSTKISNTATLTSNWVRYKFEGQTTAFNLNQPYFHPLTTGATYDIRNIQIEAKPYTTPFVNGTRGTTVATGGGLIDMSRNNNNGGFVNNPTFDSDNLGSIVFDGVDDIITVPSTNLINCDYSVDVWVKCNTINRINGIIGDLQFDWWALSIQSNNTVRARHKESDALGGPVVISNTQITANKWYHICMTFSLENGMKLYINGIIDNSTSNTQPFLLNNRGPQYIGQYRGGSSSSPNVLDGDIAMVRIYKFKTLTANEVQNNYNALKGRFGL